MKPSWGIGLAAVFVMGYALTGPGSVPDASAKPLDWLKSKISKSDEKTPDEAANPDGLVEVEKAGGVVIPQVKPGLEVTGSVSGTPAQPEMLTLAEAQYNGTARLPSMKPPPPPPSMYELAHEYEKFSADLDQISTMKINTPKTVRSAYNTLAAPHPDLLATGWMAKAARIVSETPAFQRTLDAKLEKDGREKFVKKLTKSKKYASKTFKDPAIERTIVQAIADDVGAMHTLGASFRETAIQMGRSRWGANEQEPITTFASTGNTAKAYQLSNARPMATMGPIADRILNLAARMSIGAAEGSHRAETDKLVTITEMNQCLSWAKLNMNQCSAAAAKPSELAFCTGKHALKERANCWSWLVSFDDTI